MIYICPEYRRNTQWSLLQKLWLLHVISHTWKCSTTIIKKDKETYTWSRAYSSIIYRYLKNIQLVSLPLKWYAGYDYLPGNTNQMIIGFHQLSSFGDELLRSIKKQIIMTKGIYKSVD